MSGPIDPFDGEAGGADSGSDEDLPWPQPEPGSEFDDLDQTEAQADADAAPAHDESESRTARRAARSARVRRRRRILLGIGGGLLVLVLAFVASVFYAFFGTIHEYASGPAVEAEYARRAGKAASLAEIMFRYTGYVMYAAPFGVFLMTQYFRATPQELEEAAALDGASRFKIFWRILLPLSLPAQATLGIFTFLSTWNDYWWPLISATDSDMYTLTVGVASSQMNFAQTNGLGFLMAQAVFASVPILIVYVIFQRYIVAGVSRAAA